MRLIRILSIIVIGLAGGSCAEGKWEAEMARFAAVDAAAPSPGGSVLFVGSSSIRLWRTLAEDFPRAAVVNRGFGGSEISDAIAHFDVLVKPHRPRLIVFYAGSNDLARGKSVEKVAADYAEFCAKVHAALPQTRIVFLSIVAAPRRWELRESIGAANETIATFCAMDPRREFLDVNAVLADADGTPRRELFSADRLHLSQLGYLEWVKTVGPRLDREERETPATQTTPAAASAGLE